MGTASKQIIWNPPRSVWWAEH